MLSALGATALVLSAVSSLSAAAAPPIYIISTVAGSGNDTAGVLPGDGSDATSAALPLPQSAVDENGDLIVVSYSLNAVFNVFLGGRRAGTIRTEAGTGVAGYSGDGGPATRAELNGPNMARVRPSDNAVIVIDSQNNVVRALVKNGSIVTVAGNGRYGFVDSADPLAAGFQNPKDLDFQADGDVLICDHESQRIRIMDATTGAITTVAGTGQMGFNGDGIAAVIARLHYPTAVAVAPDGHSFYIADRDNHRVRFVDAKSGLISTVAGTGAQGYDAEGLPATSSRLNGPWGLAVDRAGVVYVAEAGGARLRVFATGGSGSGALWTLAGTGVAGYNGDGFVSLAAQLNFPQGVSLLEDGRGGPPTIFLADSVNRRVRLLRPAAAALAAGAAA